MNLCDYLANYFNEHTAFNDIRGEALRMHKIFSDNLNKPRTRETTNAPTKEEIGQLGRAAVEAFKESNRPLAAIPPVEQSIDAMTNQPTDGVTNAPTETTTNPSPDEKKTVDERVEDER